MKINTEDTMDAYVREGEEMAFALGNRGAIKFNANGTLDEDIVETYWRVGFYVFEGALGDEELEDLQADLAHAFERAPHTKDAVVDAKGRKALGADLARQPFRFVRPLSDPVGGYVEQ